MHRLESDLGLVRPTGRRAHDVADMNLKQWARGYLYHDRREIKGDTGNSGGSSLGRDYKRNNKENNIFGHGVEEIDDPRYRTLNTIVLSLSPFSHSVVHRHYVERFDTTARDYSAALGMSKSKYYSELREAKQEFIARGGINN